MKEKRTLLLCGTAVILVLGTGACASADVGAGRTESEAPAKTEESFTDIDDDRVSLNSGPRESEVRVPEASGTITYGNDLAVLDASNTGNGYVMI